MAKDKSKSGMSRRSFLKGFGGSVVGTAAIGTAHPVFSAETEHARIVGPGQTEIAITVNGKKHTLEIDPRMTLLDVLRNELSYTGTKQVCNRGECGSCTVILNGRTVLACHMLALDANGADIETIEGLAAGEKLHPVQEKFVEHDAFQCGYCTPGFILSSVALLRRNSSPTPEEIRAGVSGNVCRCGTYPNIFAAVEAAAQSMKKGG